MPQFTGILLFGGGSGAWDAGYSVGVTNETKPRLLDLFCGAGGCAMGYSRAGFEVVGVDIKPQPRYPFEFHQGDALEYARLHGHEFDAIHASPPCQAHSMMLHAFPQFRKNHVSLIEPTRDLLQAIGQPYVIENVPGAPLKNYIVLCGTMFGLVTPCGARLIRHRWFETSWMSMAPKCDHGGGHQSKAVTGQGAPVGGRRTITVTGHGGSRGTGRPTFTVQDARSAMGIDWTNRDELSQAIPPAYTEFIGKQLIQHLQERAA